MHRPEVLSRVAELFAPHPVYLVGGYVRNMLLGIGEGDLDICSPLTPGQLSALLADHNDCILISKAPEFGTVELHLSFHGKKYTFEHTTFRRDSYPKGGRHIPSSVSFVQELSVDARRRDFTINALYLNCADGTLEDPFGGLHDLNSRTLRCCDTPQETLGNDGVRILRLIRFACQLNFTIDPKLYRIAKQNVAFLSDISKERLQQEFTQILLSDVRYNNAAFAGVFPPERGLGILRDMGAFPFLFPDCSFEKVRSFSLLACSPADLCIRFALFLSPFYQENTGIVGRLLGQNGLKYGTSVINTVSAYLASASACSDTVLCQRKTLSLLGRKRAEGFLKFLYCLSKEKAERLHGEYETMLRENAPFGLQELYISGNDIMRELGLKPSKRIQEIKISLWEHCLLSPNDNNPDRLLSLLHSP